jgi:hypothetical protein
LGRRHPSNCCYRHLPERRSGLSQSATRVGRTLDRAPAFDVAFALDLGGTRRDASTKRGDGKARSTSRPLLPSFCLYVARNAKDLERTVALLIPDPAQPPQPRRKSRERWPNGLGNGIAAGEHGGWDIPMPNRLLFLPNSSRSVPVIPPQSLSDEFRSNPDQSIGSWGCATCP